VQRRSAATGSCLPRPQRPPQPRVASSVVLFTSEGGATLRCAPARFRFDVDAVSSRRRSLRDCEDVRAVATDAVSVRAAGVIEHSAVRASAPRPTAFETLLSYQLSSAALAPDPSPA